MLYDVFISHASEDKDDFVRLLAERLQEQHLEVWYDEFSLRLGDSLRRSIDRGLAQSRYGIVVLSRSFFAKHWSQWELDGLVARQNSGDRDVLLPIWHGIGRDEVLAYSPSLADRVAVASSDGIDRVVRRLTDVLRPQGSTLVYARDYLIKVGVNPPVISDDWWLDVAAAAESNPMEGDFQEAMGWGRWGFPLPPTSTEPSGRGLRLAWAALQMDWQREADQRPITQITHPEIVHEFIESQAGLSEACHEYLNYLVTYAPQLAIRGLGGQFEDDIEAWYQLSASKGRCPEDLAFRAPNFGGFDAANMACGFIQGNAVMSGPPVRYYEHIDYAAWLLSEECEWLPSHIRSQLLQGMADWAVWPWYRGNPRFEDDFGFQLESYTGKLFDALHRARKRETFRLSRDARKDLMHRLDFSANILGLPESGERLAQRFLEADFIDGYFRDRR